MSSDLRHRVADFRPWRIDRYFAIDLKTFKSEFVSLRGHAKASYNGRREAQQTVSHDL